MRIENTKKHYLPEIKKIIMFKFLNDRELADMLGITELVVYEPGEYIVKQEEIDQSLYAVLSGSVQVSLNKDDKQNIYICTIGDGEVFGEAGLFIKVKRTADVISLDETVVLRLSREKLIWFIKKHPSTGNKMLMVIIYSLLRKLKEANQELAFERQFDAQQDDVDAIVQELTSSS